jgi:hypothetical protein
MLYLFVAIMSYVNLPLSLVNPPNGSVGSVNLFSLNGYLSFAPQNDIGQVGTVFTRTFNGRVTANRTYALPDQSGTLALLSDVNNFNPLSFASLGL